MTERETESRIHRFRDAVAVSIGDGPTRYLSATLARRIADALKTYADDVERVGFTKSELVAIRLQDTTAEGEDE